MTAAPGRRRGIARGEPAYSRGCLPVLVCLMGERFRQLEALRGQSWSGCDPWQLEHMCANLHVSSLLHLPWLYLRHEDPTVGVGGGMLLPVVAGLPRLMGPETSSPAGDLGFVGRGRLCGHPGGSTSNRRLPGPCQ